MLFPLVALLSLCDAALLRANSPQPVVVRQGAGCAVNLHWATAVVGLTKNRPVQRTGLRRQPDQKKGQVFVSTGFGGNSVARPMSGFRVTREAQEGSPSTPPPWYHDVCQLRQLALGEKGGRAFWRDRALCEDPFSCTQHFEDATAP